MTDPQVEHLYQDALAKVVGEQKASTSWLQRQLRIGYNAAARLIERMEAEGIVGGPDHVGRREVLTTDLAAASAASVRSQIVGTLTITPSTEGKSMTDTVSAEQLRLLIERVERLEEEKKGLGDDIKDVYAEAKSTGFDTKAMKEIVRLRKMEKHQRDEAQAMIELYKQALGLV